MTTTPQHAQRATQLVSLPGTVIEHLYNGTATPLAQGTCSLSLFSLPPPPPYIPGNDDGGKANSKGSLPPPLPSRPVTPADQWLILSLFDDAHGASPDPIFELPIPSTARILTLPPYAYIIPNSISAYALLNGQPTDVAAAAVAAGKQKASTENEDEAGFIKVTLSNDVHPEERELFESTLWGLTSASFSPPVTSASSSSKPLSPTGASRPAPPLPIKGAASDRDLRSALVLIDQDTGRVLGELETGSAPISEAPSLSQEHQGEHEKEPVVIDISESNVSGGVGGGSSGGKVSVVPVSQWQPTPNPTGSSIITLADYVSCGLVVGAETLAKGMEWSSNKFVASTKPNQTPLVFSARTKANVQGGHKFTQGATVVSAKTIGLIGNMASNVGDRVGKSLGIQSSPSGKPPTGLKGIVNKSLVAFNTIADGLETGGKTLLAAGSTSTSQAVGHRYGQEAANVTSQFGGSVKHVALVYIDARGVTRKALLKSVGKSAIRAKMTDGSEVILDQNSLVRGGGAQDREEKEIPYGSDASRSGFKEKRL